jgi:hypothetical protein
MTRTKRYVVALTAFTLASCAGVDPIEMSSDPATLPAFKTYRVEEEQLAFATEISAEERSQVAGELRKAVTDALAERGYTQSGADADVLVSLGAASRLTFDSEAGPNDSRLRHVDPSVLEAGRPPEVPGNERGPSDAAREGDLFVYLLDPKTKRVIWRASTSGAATTPSEARRRARATYAAMIGKLPKAAGTQR